MNICSQIALWKRRTLASWTEAVKAVGQAQPEPNADTATGPFEAPAPHVKQPKMKWSTHLPHIPLDLNTIAHIARQPIPLDGPCDPQADGSNAHWKAPATLPWAALGGRRVDLRAQATRESVGIQQCRCRDGRRRVQRSEWVIESRSRALQMRDPCHCAIEQGFGSSGPCGKGVSARSPWAEETGVARLTSRHEFWCPR